ncbi:hypothetical protein [Rahnella variigena]|uniref:hypothetical protein n=1 Tax=Rahnella variigena TaxID=574964 RepID=UPI00132FCAEC|nr:hypothetical protein [Rahnella variigena]
MKEFFYEKSDFTRLKEFIKRVFAHKSIIRYSLYCALITIFVFYIIISNFSNGTSSVTDWFSAIADITMAITAISAVILAKNYLSDVVDKDGYTTALKIKNEIIPKFRTNSHYLSYSSFIEVEVKTFISGDLDIWSTGNSFDALVQSLVYIEKEMKQSKILIHTLEESFRNLSLYGWEMVAQKRDLIDKAIKIVDECNTYSHNIYHSAKEISERTKPDLLPHEPEDIRIGFQAMTKEKLIEIINRNTQNLHRAYSGLEGYFLQFDSGNIRILSFFKSLN